MRFNSKTLSGLTVAAVMAILSVTTPAKSEIKKIMLDCGGKLCPYLQASVTIPKGWQEDKAASREKKMQILVPVGKTFSNAGAIIYAAVEYNAAKTPIATLVEQDHANWRKKTADVKIERLPDVAHASGGEPFLHYQFEMPSRKSQSFERVASTSDTDNDNNAFLVAIVLTAMSKKALRDTEPAYLTILKSY